MKLISMSCPSCGAALEVNADLKSGICNYCGRPFAIDPEVIHVQHDVSEDAGYKFEKGRIKAQEEAQAKERRIAEAEAERKRLEEERQMRQAEEYRAQQKKAEKRSNLFAVLGGLSALIGLVMLFIPKEAFSLSKFIGTVFIIGTAVCIFFIAKIYKQYKIKRSKDDIFALVVFIVIAVIRLIAGS